MTERAAHLVDEVIPSVPVRQWVLTLPYRLRYLLAWDHALSRAVLAIHVRALLDFYRRQAQRQGIPAGRRSQRAAVRLAADRQRLRRPAHVRAWQRGHEPAVRGAARPEPRQCPGQRRPIRTPAFSQKIREGLPDPRAPRR
jgi:hypothetical protein